MDQELIAKVNESGLKKKFIAEKLDIVPNHLYQCLLGNRRLSTKKQDALRKLLTTVN
jgi:hypothetical protein